MREVAVTAGFPFIRIQRPKQAPPDIEAVGHFAVLGHDLVQHATDVPCPFCHGPLTRIELRNNMTAGRSFAVNHDGTELGVDVLPADIEPMLCFDCHLDLYRVKP